MAALRAVSRSRAATASTTWPTNCHGVDGQQRVAGHQRADVFQARYVFMSDGDSHAFEGVAGRGVEADDSSVGAVQQARVQVQLVGNSRRSSMYCASPDTCLAALSCLTLRPTPVVRSCGEQLGEFGLGFSTA